jgi:hypothetical protein
MSFQKVLIQAIKTVNEELIAMPYYEIAVC